MSGHAEERCPACGRPLDEVWWSCKHCGEVLKRRIFWNLVLAALLWTAAGLLPPIIPRPLLSRLVRTATTVLGTAGLVGMAVDLLSTRKLRAGSTAG